MKKALCISAFVAISLSLFAEVKLTSGSLNVVKNAGEYAYVEIDWSKAKVVELGYNNKVDKDLGTITQYNKAQGADWVKDWPKIKRLVENSTALESYPMRPCFNSKNKKGTRITVNHAIWNAYAKSSDEKEKKDMKNRCIWENPSNAKYKFVFTVSQIDMGNGAAAAFGMGGSSGGAIISGTIKLIDIKTGKQLALINVDHCKGKGSYYQQMRLTDVVVAEVFAHIAKLIK